MSFLVGYSIVTGALLGVLLAHYYFIAGRTLSMVALYDLTSTGGYWYTLGFNWRAFVAMGVAVAPCLPGLVMLHSGSSPGQHHPGGNHGNHSPNKTSPTPTTSMSGGSVNVWADIYTAAWIFTTVVSMAVYTTLMRLVGPLASTEGEANASSPGAAGVLQPLLPAAGPSWSLAADGRCGSSVGADDNLAEPSRDDPLLMVN
jgi:cytosine/uracil/thiamine/allantoin permease